MVNEQERKRIGECIATIRMAKGITQDELADKAGIQRTNIRKIEQGRYGIPIDVLAAIADALDCKVVLIGKEMQI